MKKTAMVSLLAGMLLVTAVIAQQKKQQEIDLQAAIRTETVKGDLKGAIKQYEVIVAKYPKDRAVAAQALLHMAACYRKLGDSEAQNLYQRVVRDYSDQKEASLAARTGLAVTASPSASMRRLLHPSSTENLTYYGVSPDGQWLGGTDWNQGDMVQIHVSTAEVRRLVTASDPQGNRWGETPLVSPDGRQVAFWWFDDKDQKADADYDGELRIMPNEPGAKPRALRKSAYPAAWSPDGKSILATLNPDRQNQTDIAWISADDGSARIVKTVKPWRKLARVSLSPDGMYIAYAGLVREGAPESNIYVISKDGSSQAELIRGDINEEPTWTPDGGHVLFSSNRSGSFGIWSVPVGEGERTGPPTFVTAETGRIHALGATSAGTYLYERTSGLDQVLVQGMDPSGARDRGPVMESFVGVNPKWSPDGKWLAYRRAHAGDPNFDLIVHSFETGSDLTASRQGGDGYHWLLDEGLEYLASGGARKRVDLGGGEPKEIETHAEFIRGNLSPDNKAVYRLANRDPKNSKSPQEGFERIDTATGQRTQWFPLSASGIGGTTDLTRDGRTLLYESPGKDPGTRRIMRVSVDGTGEKEILGPAPKLGPLAETNDANSILFAQFDEKGSGRIMRIPAQGGQPEFTGISAERLRWIALSPDGSKIAYSAASRDREVWAIDNVLGGLR